MELDSTNVSRALIEDGIPCNLRGYKYLREAIESYKFEEKTISMYKRIAAAHGSSMSRIESAIRTATAKSASNHNGRGNAAYIAWMHDKICYEL